MTTSPQDPSVTTSTPTSLPDMEIPGATGTLPAPPAAAGETLWGINHGAVLDNFPNNGLQLYIPAWTTMSAGDSVSVLLGEAPVTTKPIAANEVNQRVTAFVEARHLVSGRYTLKHRVKRLGQAEETSAETRILVKLDRPGGKDQNGDIPGHSQLKLSIPQQIVEFGVDADDAKAGVPVTIAPYPGMAHRDSIRLSWGGVIVKHEVEAGQVDQEIVILVEEKYILEGGDSTANGLAVTFEVYDIVDNRSEDWSAEIRIVVKTDESRLLSPIVEEATGNVLDLDTLGSAPVTVQVWVMDDRKMMKQLYKSLTPEQAARLRASMGKETFSNMGEVKGGIVEGDKIVVKLTGTTLDGQRVIYEAPEVLVIERPENYKIPVPNAVVRQLAQTQAVFSYRVLHKDNTESTSKGAFTSVIGEALRMAAPVAEDAVGGTIDPTLLSTTVRIPWDDSMAMGDELILKWIGTYPNQTIYDPELDSHFISGGEATDKESIVFIVQGTHLSAIKGGTLQLYFILSKVVGEGISKRESARAATLKVGEHVPELPKPLVAAVQDGAIVPPYVATTLTVPVYPAMAVGDLVNYLWKGSIAGSAKDTIPITDQSVNKAVSFTIKAERISDNAGGTVEASYWVGRANGNISDSDVLVFSVGQPVVLEPPVIKDVKDSKGQNIADGESTSDTNVNLSGTASAGLGVEVLDDGVSKGQTVADASGQWALPLNGLAIAAHVITAKALYGQGQVSAARRFSVTAPYPIITSIKDSSGAEVPEKGETTDLLLTFSGLSNANSQVRLLDAEGSDTQSGEVIATVSANSNGEWTVTADVRFYEWHVVWILTDTGTPSAPRTFYTDIDAGPPPGP